MAQPALVVMVLNNGDLNQVTWEQRVMEGDPKFAALAGRAGRSLTPSTREMLGFSGIRVDDPERDRRGLGRGARRRAAGR